MAAIRACASTGQPLAEPRAVECGAHGEPCGVNCHGPDALTGAAAGAEVLTAVTGERVPAICHLAHALGPLSMVMHPPKSTPSCRHTGCDGPRSSEVT